MSTTSVTRSSPVSSPRGSSSRHGHASTPRASTARITTPSGGALRTPRPKAGRNQSSLQPQDARDASPNYFNLSISHSSSYGSSGDVGHARTNFSPPTSQVRSTAAISPKMVPLDQNPELAEFRRQSDLRLSNGGGFFANAPSAPKVAFPGTKRTSSSQSTSPESPPAKIHSTGIDTLLHEHADKPRSPKRMLSSNNDLTDRPRRTSPAGFSHRDTVVSPTNITFLNNNYINLSLPPTTIPSPLPSQPSVRAETLPAHQQSIGMDPADGTPFASPSHVVTLLEASPEEIMLLDLRVSTQYARSRIHAALNLCIPTTLLKRASYNTSKLAETFTRNPDQKEKFERWRSCKYIIVYDASASKIKDALPCVSMLKKFASEGWSGQSHIIRGGFVEFAKYFPNLVEYGNGASSGSESPPSSSSTGHSLPPVIGGCPMPATKNAANPFFGNIRQNMDLIGGVGQMSVQVPTTMSAQHLERIPKWLRNVSRSSDEGKIASDNFLAIEKGEQKRMQNALSTKIDYGNTDGADKQIRVAGIEKGSKNRYNNIWPYEHTRVKLEDVKEGACDYVNANHVSTLRSKNRYIATQGPIPATFADFWNMVWQQDARVIVMLTAEMESGQIKAHNYWSDKRFGHLRLTFLSESRASIEPAKINRHKSSRPSAGPRRSTHSHLEKSSPKADAADVKEDEPYVMVRRFTLSNGQEPFERMREITQLQYSNWPDFGAPAHPTHLLGLVEQCNKVVRSSRSSSSNDPASMPALSRPIVVHCSAGCGRTGTFCTVDSVIDMLKQQKAHRSTHKSSASPDAMQGLEGAATKHGQDNWLDRDDIDLVEQTVADFRLQRLSMVQSLRQYVLCYESILEWLAEQ